MCSILWSWRDGITNDTCCFHPENHGSPDANVLPVFQPTCSERSQALPLWRKWTFGNSELGNHFSNSGPSPIVQSTYSYLHLNHFNFVNYDLHIQLSISAFLRWVPHFLGLTTVLKTYWEQESIFQDLITIVLIELLSP